MTLKHLQQPAGSRLCGQTCVAMLAGVSIDTATFHCTSGKNRSTSEHDLRKGLAMLGQGLDPFERRKRVEPFPNHLVSVAPILARLRSADRKHGYHWILITRTQVFDPSLTSALPVEAYVGAIDRVWDIVWGSSPRLWVSSFARVLPMTAFLGASHPPYPVVSHELGTHREAAPPYLRERAR